MLLFKCMGAACWRGLLRVDKRQSHRLTRQLGCDCYVIGDPFGAAINGVPSLERAVEIATGLAENVREWAGAPTFDC